MKSTHRLLPLLLLLALALFLHGDGRVGLFESSEARYAEVAREMVHTGDYLSPQMDYVYHFTKPPLTYWITAAGYRLFGVNPLGARFFLAIAAVLVLWLTSRMARLKRPEAFGLWAAAVLLATVEFFVMAKVLTTDMFLTLFIVAGLALWSLREEERIGLRAFQALFGLTAALAFLTKGPVALLFWAVVLVPYGLWKDGGRSLRVFFGPLCWGLFLLGALPWFIAVGLEHPGLLAYLATRESTEAAYSARRYHPGGWFYYLPVLLAGLFPWWMMLAGGWRRLGDRRVRLWLLWAVLPVLVWSCFPAKLPTYILPALPAWALLAGYLLEEDRPGRAAATLMPLVMAGAAGGAIALLYTHPPLSPEPGALLLVPLGLALAAGLAGAAAGLGGRRRLAAGGVLAAMLLLQAAAPALCVRWEDGLKIRTRMGETLKRDWAPGETVLEYRVSLYSVPFYLGHRVAAYRNNFIRMKYVEEVPPNIFTEHGALEAFVRSHPRLWVVTDTRGEQAMHRDIPGLTLVLRQGNHSLWATAPVARRLAPPPPAAGAAGG